MNAANVARMLTTAFAFSYLPLVYSVHLLVPVALLVVQHGLVEEAVEVAGGLGDVAAVAATGAEAERRLEAGVQGVAVQGRARHERGALGPGWEIGKSDLAAFRRLYVVGAHA